ncbi:stage II sporulation protein D [Clostridium gelidum]|uniref:Stage II sporulation protein D n=1 Tax=Clostridium gelidum TaxID=704125 RepID=A0ABN6IR88_9CLOT|nr:stage II sporulation protein D [Clostridium gelidum]BCZ44517.1 stage II sporulation protein D [Clostridium gelidum]
MKITNIKIDSSIKIITIITLIIFAILIVLPLIFLRVSKESINVFNLNNNNIVNSSEIIFPINGKVKIYRKEEDKIEELDLEEYIMGVVASEVPANFNEEALKAQAIAARTFYMNRRNDPCKDAKNKGAEICDTTNCQVYMNKEERIAKWSSSQAEINWDKIKKAVLDTKSQVLTYDDLVLKYPQFFAISSGKTEDAKDVFSMDVPYLKSEESKGEEIAPKYKTTIQIPIGEFINKINAKYSTANLKKSNLSLLIKIESYTESGSVKEIKIGDKTLKGTEFRELFNLNSTNFKFDFEKDIVKINCIGYGHGVGMSQWGANAMAQNGAKYDEILKHYYSGVEIQKIKFTP